MVQRPAWEVVFEGIKVAITLANGIQQRNPHITKITVLLDAESGTFSLPDLVGGGREDLLSPLDGS